MSLRPQSLALALALLAAAATDAAAARTESATISLEEKDAGIATEVVVEVTGEFDRFGLENGRPVLRCRKGKLQIASASIKVSVAPDRPGVIRTQSASFDLDDSGRCRTIAVQFELSPSPEAPGQAVHLSIDLIMEMAYTSDRLAAISVVDLKATPAEQEMQYSFGLRIDVSALGDGNVTWMVLRQQVVDGTGREVHIDRPFREMFDRPQTSGLPRTLSGLEVAVPASAFERGEVVFQGVAIGVTDRGLLVVEDVRFALRPRG